MGDNRPSAFGGSHLQDFRRLLAEFAKESPRGRVMICAAVLDDQLGKVIQARLIDHPDAAKLIDGFNAPLGTFASRILCAFALGTISEPEYRDLEQIRKIRNEFAHNMHASFGDPKIMERCARLSLAAQDYGDVVVSPVGRFDTAATALVLNLTNRAHYVGQERIAYQHWRY